MRKKRKIIISVLVTATLVGGTIALLHTGFVKSEILKRIQKSAERQGIDLALESFTYNLLRLKFDLKGIRLRAAGQKDAPAFFQAEHVLLRLSPAQLYRRGFFIKALEVQDAAVVIVKSASGASNLPSPRSGISDRDRTRRLPVISIDEAILAGTRIRYQDETHNVTVELSEGGVNVRGTETGLQELNLDPTLKGFVETTNSRFLVKDISFQAAFDRESLLLQQFRMAVGESTFEASGRADNLGSPLFHLNIIGDIDMRDIPGDRRVPLSLSKRLRMDLALNGNMQALNVHLQANTAGGELSGPAASRLKADLQWKENVLSVPAMEIGIFGGSIKGEGTWYPVASDGRSQLKLHWKDVNLEKVSSLSSKFPAILASTSGNIAAEWGQFTFKELQAQAGMSLESTKEGPTKAGSFPVRGHLTGVLANGEAEITAEGLSFSGANATGRLRGSADRISGEIDCSCRSLNSLMISLSELLPEPMQAALHSYSPDGSLDVSGRLGGSLRHPRVSADILGTGLSFSTLDDLELSCRLQADTGGVNFDTFKLRDGEGDLEIRGRLPFQAKEKIDMMVTGQGLELARFAGLVALEDELQGRLSFRLSAVGDYRDLEVQGQGAATGLQYRDREVGTVTFEIDTQQEGVTFSMEIPRFSSRIQGTQQTQPPYAFSAGMVVEDWNWSGEEISLFTTKPLDLSGRISTQSRLTAELSRWQETLRLEADIRHLSFKWDALNWENATPFSLRYEDRILLIERLNMRGSGIHLWSEGTVSFDPASPGVLEWNLDMDLNAVSSLFENVEMSGHGNTSGIMKGMFSKLELYAGLEVSGANWESRLAHISLEDINIKLDIVEGVMDISEMSFSVGGGSVSGTGAIPLAAIPVFEGMGGGGAIDIRLHMEDVDPFQFLGRAESVFPPASAAEIGGDIHVHGERMNWRNLSADAEWQVLRLRVSETEFQQEAPAVMRLQQGRLHIEPLAFSGPGSRIRLGGMVDLPAGGALDIGVEGEMNLTFFKDFFENAVPSGVAQVKMRLADAFPDIKAQGSVSFQDAGLLVVYPRLLFSRVTGDIRFTGMRVDVEDLSGDLNGGTFFVRGGGDFIPWRLENLKLEGRAENVWGNFPAGLNSILSGDFLLESAAQDFLLSGKVRIEGARYTEDFNLQSELYRYLRRGSSGRYLRKPPDRLRQFRLDIDVSTAMGVRIDNNLAKADVTADLKVSGTAYNPALSGRATIAEGGELYFHRNTFVIEEGVVNFTNPYRIEPDLNVQTRIRVQEYDISLFLTGTPESFTANFSSDPELSQVDIISVLITGRTLDSASSAVLDIAGHEAISYLDSALAGQLEQLAERALGIESVRIDTGLVATEENPGARISFGQHLRRNLEFVFSQDLKDARNRTWILNYNPVPSLNLQGVKRDDNEYNLEVRYQLSFGLKDQAELPGQGTAAEAMRMGKLAFRGNQVFETSRLREFFKFREGRKFDLFAFRKALERLRRFYIQQGYLNAVMKATRVLHDGAADYVIDIESGPRIRLEYRGARVGRKLEQAVKEVWAESGFTEFALLDAADRLRRAFISRNHFQVEIAPRVREADPDTKVVVFQITPGPKFHRIFTEYGEEAFFMPDRLDEVVKRGDWIESIFLRPRIVLRRLAIFYRDNGFPDVKVRYPVFRFFPEERTAGIIIPVVKGDRYRFQSITFSGNRFFSEDDIQKNIPIKAGDFFSAASLESAVEAVTRLHATAGFQDAAVEPIIEPGKDGSDTYSLEFRISENRRAVVSDIRILGNDLTRDRTIVRELTFRKGDPVDYRRINQSRKKLYDLGVFRRVDITVIPDTSAEDSPAAQEDVKTDINPCSVEIRTYEQKPYRTRWGIQYDTETRFGVSGDLINRSLFGLALLTGGSLRWNQDEWDARAFFRSPHFWGRRIDTELFAFLNSVEKPAWTTRRAGLTLQQQIKLRTFNILSYNYTLERIRTLFSESGATSELKPLQHFGSLSVAFTRDTRDNLLNARRGLYITHGLEVALRGLGSDFPYARYFGQANMYQRLTPFLLYATSLRLGLGESQGQGLPPAKRFFGGGGTTLRGFEKNALGPLEERTGLPTGGDAVLIFNQELRFPLYKRLGGVVFMDIGNVYARAADIRIADTRETAGFGLRYDTPYFLLRFDWGFKLDRRPGETLSAIFFSIGQAF